jgi:hypothetical protein
VNAFEISADSEKGSIDAKPHLTLQLHTQDDAAQALKRFAASSAKTTSSTALLDAHRPEGLFNPFDAAGLSQGLPTLVPTASGQARLPNVELSQWQWVGALRTADKSGALLAHDGQLYTLRPGQALGANGGEVTEVGTDHLWLRQWVADSQGQWQAHASRWPLKGSP